MPLVPPYIESLAPYLPGQNAEEVRRQYGLDRVIKLGSNENPLGPSRLAIDAVLRTVDSLNVYPNGGMDFRRVPAPGYDCPIENAVVGGGSEGIMPNPMPTFFLNDQEWVISACPCVV